MFAEAFLAAAEPPFGSRRVSLRNLDVFRDFALSAVFEDDAGTKLVTVQEPYRDSRESD